MRSFRFEVSVRSCVIDDSTSSFGGSLGNDTSAFLSRSWINTGFVGSFWSWIISIGIGAAVVSCQTLILQRYLTSISFGSLSLINAKRKMIYKFRSTKSVFLISFYNVCPITK